jgi:hypothetical protein
MRLWIPVPGCCKEEVEMKYLDVERETLESHLHGYPG